MSYWLFVRACPIDYKIGYREPDHITTMGGGKGIGVVEPTYLQDIKRRAKSEKGELHTYP